MQIYIGIGFTIILVIIGIGSFGFVKKFGARETKLMLLDCFKYITAFVMTILTKRISTYMSKRDCSKPDLYWSKSRLAREICDDLCQNSIILASGILLIALAQNLNSDHNPLLNVQIVRDMSDNELDKAGLQSLAHNLNILSTLLTLGISVLVFGLLLSWCFTNVGDKVIWMKVFIIFIPFIPKPGNLITFFTPRYAWPLPSSCYLAPSSCWP